MQFSEEVTWSPGQAESWLDKVLAGVVEDRTPEESLHEFGLLIDLSSELARPDATLFAVNRLEGILRQPLSNTNAILANYFLGNAWEVVRRQRRQGDALAEWEQPEIGKQILYLRKAARLIESTSSLKVLPRDRVTHCQVFTNLGNLLAHCGRPVEAISYWDKALTLNPNFAMAIANRGRGFFDYGAMIHDRGHQAHHLRAAHKALARSRNASQARCTRKPESIFVTSTHILRSLFRTRSFGRGRCTSIAFLPERRAWSAPIGRGA